MRTAGALLLGASLLLAGRPAGAAGPDLRACVDAYERGQHLLHGPSLQEAREQLLVCARAPCPAQMWSDCQRWLSEVEQNMPSVVLAARDADGRDVADVVVLVDNRPFLDRLDARAHPLDPGDHVFRFQRNGREVEQRVMLREGEKARVVTAQIEPLRAASAPVAPPPASVVTAPPSTAPPVRSVPLAAYVFGGVGAAALGGFAYFGLTGRDQYFALKASCSPNCSTSDVAPARTKLMVADILLGVSVLSLGIATYLFVTAPPARETRHGGNVHLDLRASARGAQGTLTWLY